MGLRDSGQPDILAVGMRRVEMEGQCKGKEDVKEEEGRELDGGDAIEDGCVAVAEGGRVGI